MTSDRDHDAGPTFAVWCKDGSEADARVFQARRPWDAAEQRAREDHQGPSWQVPTTYRVRSKVTGRIWDVTVGVVQAPSFVTLEVRDVEMLAATHVLWGGRALCEDLRLRGVPRDWPPDQRWISLKDVADGAAAPPDPCEACWGKAPALVEGIRQIGSDR